MSKIIMIVDDSLTMRKMVGFTLRQAGYQVEEAADGVEALDWLKANHADLILTDVHMPRMDGLTLTGEVRSVARYSKTPILALTTDDSEALKQKGKSAGATGWIVKPFDTSELCLVLSRLLNPE